MANNNQAFDAMMNSTQTTGELYTESHYNTNAGKEDQIAMDRKAQSFLKKMYKDDQAAGLFEKLNYDQYTASMSPSFFQERVTYPKETDPSYFEEIGTFFNDNYEGDFDQFLASSRKYKPKK